MDAHPNRDADANPDPVPGRDGLPRTVSPPLSAEERWTLHHLLIDRLEAEATDTDRVDPPPVEVFRAFETLDGGGASFTLAQLAAVRSVLSEYHHATTWWEVERPRIEQLLHPVSGPRGPSPLLDVDRVKLDP